MGPRRHYSPGVVFHAPHCVEGGNALAVGVRGAIEVHPNYQFDACFGGLFPPRWMLPRDPRTSFSTAVAPVRRSLWVAAAKCGWRAG
jgi:hypothetical protein